MNELVIFLFTVVSIEAVTEILAKSKIVSPLRNFFERRGGKAGELLSCAFCISVWVSGIHVAFWMLDTPWYIIFITATVGFRMSNVLSDIFDWVRNRKYPSHMFGSEDKK